MLAPKRLKRFHVLAMNVLRLLIIAVYVGALRTQVAEFVSEFLSAVVDLKKGGRDAGS